ncbi:hypothetical protein UFOVP386_4 [uncultured Caudovirales phage]|uniref:Uncharacterized protein n=1 Tax=uncultured Caudovirales phage TaxID=2100421 RepID=A0A6J7X0B5_9CAUD|nr:hypothetical protein UFOVP386_4 [uncultured Caudovirales phage]
MELKRLEEYQLMKFKTSLTEDEKKYLDVSKSGNHIKDCNIQELKKMIIFASVTYGVNHIPSMEEEKILYHAIHSTYPHNTIEELNYALFLNATGKYWERIQCFNLISIPFLCDCMNQYIQWSRKMNNELKKKEILELKSSDEFSEEKINWIEWLERDKKSYKVGKEGIHPGMDMIPLSFSRVVISSLYNLQVLSDIDFSENEWKDFEVKAFRECQIQKRKKIKASIKTEMMICLYNHLLSKESLFNEVINRLKLKNHGE